MKFNTGRFVGDRYIKKVSFSKAVLWKDREISLSPAITCQFKPRGIKWIIFEDEYKNERWKVSYERAKKVAYKKKVGQEVQYYMPISVFEKEPIKIFKTKQM